MNTLAEHHAMAHKLTPAKQNEILSRCMWTADGRVRVQATHRTEPLLRSAGVHRPRALESYPVPVRRDNSGFLVIDHHHTSPAPQPESDAHLYEPGGLFAGQAPPAAGAAERPGTSERSEIDPAFFEEMRAAIRIRRFEIPTCERTRIRIEVLAYDDTSLPAPLEPENWLSRPATDAEIHAAIAALHMARQLSHLER